MSVRYILVCNNCSAVAKESSVKGVASARRMNHPHGWRNPRPGVDVCKECADKARAERKVSDAHTGYF